MTICGRGRAMSSDRVHTIVRLLRDTDMTLSEIAERVHCSRSAVITVNQKSRVRSYGGLRSSWTVNSQQGAVVGM